MFRIQDPGFKVQGSGSISPSPVLEGGGVEGAEDIVVQPRMEREAHVMLVPATCFLLLGAPQNNLRGPLEE